MEPQAFEACEDEIDLRELLATLWRGKWVIVVVTLVAAVLALGASLALPKQYEASASEPLHRLALRAHCGETLVRNAQVPDESAIALDNAPNVFRAVAADA